jgi:hypothetical protein
MAVGWNISVDGSNQSGLNAKALVRMLRALNPACIRFHRPMNDMQGNTPAGPAAYGAFQNILHRVVADIQDEGKDAPPPLSHRPRLQMVLGYGVKMTADVDGYGYQWALLGGLDGATCSLDNWKANAPCRTNFLNDYYKGYNELQNTYSRPPAGNLTDPYALWDVMVERMNGLMQDVFGGLCEKADWPPEQQYLELWNEANPTGVGGKNLAAPASPWNFDAAMIPMLDYFARHINRNFDGRGPRKLLCSTLTAMYGSANFFPYAPPEIGPPSDPRGGEIAKSIKAIQEWITKTKEMNWHGLFDGISINLYAPVGLQGTWGNTYDNSAQHVRAALEFKLNAITDFIRSSQGVWFQHLPIYINEYGQKPEWLGMVGTIPATPPLVQKQGYFYDNHPERVQLVGELRLEGARYLAERLGDDRVCMFNLSSDQVAYDISGFNMANRTGGTPGTVYVPDVYPSTFSSARPFLNAAGWDATGPLDPNGQAWNP